MTWSSTTVLSRRAGMLLALLLASLPTVHAGEIIKILTEEYPPYNYTDKGKITGLGTEVVQAVLKEINIEGQIQSVPWARAYETTQNSENVLIYSINRSKEREKLFKWVGQITPTEFYLFSLKNRNIQLTDLNSAKNLQIGTVNQDVGEQFLVGRGFSVGRNLQSSNKYELNYEKLRLGRVDLWVMNELSAYYIARQAGDDPTLVLQKSLRIPELSGGGNYMAFGPKTSDALVERFRKGLEAIKKNGIYDALQKKMAVSPSRPPADSLLETPAASATASVGSRMVLATLGFCLVFTIVAAGVRTWSAWNSNVNAMSAELELIAQVYQRTLSKSIWEMDRESLQANIDSVANASSVGQIEVALQSANHTPEVFHRTQHGWKNSSHAPVLHVKLDYEAFAGSKETVGELALYGDERVLWARLRSEVLAILVTQITQSLLLASLVMLVFNRLVTVHVRRIALHLGQLTPANLGQTLRLERAPKRQDELSQLVSGVNQLQSNLSDYLQQQQRYEQELASHRDHLADMVRERTSELESTNARLENANALLDGLAHTDPLTGLANRRHFDEIKEEEFRRALRTQHPLTLLVCDIDYFKRYNDHYGHAAGDQCLRAVAAVMQQTCARAGDLVARIGGEEFAMLLPATDAAHATQLAKQLLRNIAALDLEHRGSEVASHVTISMKRAQLDPAHTGRFELLFEQADQALYRAKSEGRNRVAVHPKPLA